MIMAVIIKWHGPLLRRMAKLPPSKFRVDRLCFRRAGSMPATDQSSLKVLYQNETPVLNVREPGTTDPDCVEHIFFRSGNFPLEQRTAMMHAVLEKCPDFRRTVFSEETLEKFISLKKKKQVRNAFTVEIPVASATDLIEFICSQTNNMSRQDFIRAWKPFSSRLPFFSNREIVDTVGAVSFVERQGESTNFGILLKSIDEELLARFARERILDLSVHCLKVLDLMYWTPKLRMNSRFFSIKVRQLLMKSKRIVYPGGVQLFLYRTCIPIEVPKFDVGRNFDFLKRIMHTCPFDVFLVALESFTFTNCIGYPHFFVNIGPWQEDLFQFLCSKAIENINDDNALIIISQFFHVHPVDINNKIPFNKLLDKISQSNASAPPLAIFYLFQAMANSGGIDFSSYNEVMKIFESIDWIHPHILHGILLTVYGNFGPDGVKRFADVYCGASTKSAFGSVPLIEFCIFCDSGIIAFHLWEHFIQSHGIVPTGFSLRSWMLLADDCINMHAPEYNGPRLGDEYRRHVYHESISQEDIFDEPSGFLKVLHEVVDGCCHFTHILPGFVDFGARDSVICTNKAGKIVNFNIQVWSTKPWNIKRLPSPDSRAHLRFFAVWVSHPSSLPYLLVLKQRCLEKLGYISIMVDHNILRLPAKDKELWLQERLGIQK